MAQIAYRSSLIIHRRHEHHLQVISTRVIPQKSPSIVTAPSASPIPVSQSKSSPPVPIQEPSMATISGAEIVTEVEKFVGDSYVYGAAGPSTFDCSGLVQYVLTTLGVQNVPRTSEDQYAWVDKVSQQQLQPGDLVFAQFPGDNASPGHVG